MLAFKDHSKTHEAVFVRQYSPVVHGSTLIKEPLAIRPFEAWPPG
jgi:hypothetical protein